MLRIGSAVILVLTVAQAGLAQQPRNRARQDLPPGAVTVLHSVDLAKLIQRLQQQGLKVGTMMEPGHNPINITTGLVVDQAGHVITRLVNLDPEDKDQDLTVRTTDGAQFRARLVGVDCPTGFAVLEVLSGSSLAPASIGAGSVDDGAEATLFSSDLGKSSTVSDGWIQVSPEVTALVGKIAPGTLYSRARGVLTFQSIGLTPRNDSGIVETLDNRIVGMAQWAGLSPGMAYVFPYDFLRGQVLARVLDRNGTVPAGSLGVTPETPVAGARRGVVVKEVQPHSTADVCGLQANDVIVGLDQYEITGQAEMAAILSALPAGSKIRLRTLRDQKPMEVEAVLGAQPVRPIITWWAPATAPVSPVVVTVGEEKLPAGLIVRDMTTQLAGYFGVKSGILVTEVLKGSPADRAGLVAGDVVVGANGRDLRSVQELKALLSAQPGAINLNVYRNKSSVAVEIPSSNLPKAK